ncbi:MAG: DUF134 domain-containing protein [Candidatus Thermoplasmatota archaeon]
MPRCGRRRRRGRRRGKRWIDSAPVNKRFVPQQTRSNKITNLTIDELEALRLVDLVDLTQQEAAQKMGVSRKTLWTDLHNARKKVTEALVNDHILHIVGGSFKQRKKSDKGGEK